MPTSLRRSEWMALAALHQRQFDSCVATRHEHCRRNRLMRTKSRWDSFCGLVHEIESKTEGCLLLARQVHYLLLVTRRRSTRSLSFRWRFIKTIDTTNVVNYSWRHRVLSSQFLWQSIKVRESASSIKHVRHVRHLGRVPGSQRLVEGRSPKHQIHIVDTPSVPDPPRGASTACQ